MILIQILLSISSVELSFVLSYFDVLFPSEILMTLHLCLMILYSAEDKDKIDALDWLLFNASHLAEAVYQTNAVIRSFIGKSPVFSMEISQTCYFSPFAFFCLVFSHVFRLVIESVSIVFL